MKRRVKIEFVVDSTEFHDVLDTNEGTLDLVLAMLSHEADLLPKEEMKITIEKTEQSVPNGTRFRFVARDYRPFFRYNYMYGKVIGLATATELGEKDFEYYDIQLANGIVLKAISGFHLDTTIIQTG